MKNIQSESGWILFRDLWPSNEVGRFPNDGGHHLDIGYECMKPDGMVYFWRSYDLPVIAVSWRPLTFKTNLNEREWTRPPEDLLKDKTYNSYEFAAHP